MTLRETTAADGASVWELIDEIGTLERNTCYAYVLFCSDFAATCRVAEEGGRLLGVVIGFRPPTHPEAVFVWQVGVHSDARGRGLGKELLHHLVDGLAADGVTHLEATVAPSNEGSKRLFEGFARERGAPCRLDADTGFRAEHFGPNEHEPEPRYRIGPIGPRKDSGG